METFAALFVCVLLVTLGFTLGLLQRRPARREALPLAAQPVRPAGTPAVGA
jgi:hypothetical protein